ncbi:TetR family transcriptional regulator [Saxibacter everestensis]|uniref:TetR family transcriptional regulator n=1 Tax=Saxibacter everestensis TaxID=2909229 RepID=A0ABY8QQB1_9MICO|nr:TetR family transcriptional regulator [Brevibacteriaceae bacterium ZFBP1038]
MTIQQIADRAGSAIGTLYLYAGTKAEVLIMVQKQKFAAAVDDGLTAAAAEQDRSGAVETVLALVRPVVACVREQPENGRTYLHELDFADIHVAATATVHLHDDLPEILRYIRQQPLQSCLESARTAQGRIQARSGPTGGQSREGDFGWMNARVVHDPREATWRVMR